MNNILSRMLTVALLGLALHAFAAPPELLVGGTAPTPAPNARWSPASASNGDGFFVAWLDRRSGSAAIVGTRVTREGRVVDPFGIRIELPGVESGADFIESVQVVWDGSAYLVAWSAHDTLYAARINNDGHIVMAPRVIAEDAALGALGELGAEGALASNGNVTVIIYSNVSEFRGRARIVILDRDGNPTAHETLPVVPLYRGNFAIAANASRFVVAWRASFNNDYRDYRIEAVALDANGHVDGAPVTVGDGERPVIATDGTHFTLAWLQFVSAGPHWRLETRTLDANLSGGTERELLMAGDIDPPSIVWRSDHYEIVATTRDYPQPADFRITSIALTSGGAPIDTRSYGMVSWHQHDLSAATNGAELLITTLESSVNPGQALTHVSARLVRGSLEDDPQLLSWSGNTHRNPRIASSPYGSLLAWQEDDGWYMARLDTNGDTQDDRGIKLWPSDDIRVAFNGTHYVVAINEGTWIGVSFINPVNGVEVASADMFLQQPSEKEIALAATPAATYVAFNDGRIQLVRIPHTPPDDLYEPEPAIAVSPADMYVDHPALAWNGSELLVGWNEQYSIPRCDPGPCITSISVYAARVSASLTLLDPAPLRLAHTELGWPSFGAPSIASNGTDWLVVTDHYGDVLATRVLQNGAVADAAPVMIARGEQPVATWDGERYIVAWKEGDYSMHERPLFAAAVPEHGQLAATRRTLITNKAADSVPSMSGTTIAYTKHSFRIEHNGVERTFLRPLDLGGVPRGRTVRR